MTIDHLLGVIIGLVVVLAIALVVANGEVHSAQHEAAAYRQRSAALCGTVQSRLTVAQLYTPAADIRRVEIQQALTETAPYVRYCGVSEEIRLQMREASLGTPPASDLEDAVWAASKALTAAREKHWPIEAP